MSEEELNKKWLKDELKEFSYSNEFLDKILDLLSKQYINGLEQSRFEKKLLELENQELKNQLEEKENQQKQFIEWLEDKLEKRKNDIKLLGQDVYISKFAYEENLSKYKEIIGVKDE